MHFEVGFRQEVTLFTTANEKLGVVAEVADFLAGVLGKVGGDWSVAGVPEFIRGFSGGDSKLRRLRVTLGLAAQGVVPGTALKQLSMGSISGLQNQAFGVSRFWGLVSPSPLISLRRRNCPIPLGPSSCPPSLPAILSLALSASVPPWGREGDTFGGSPSSSPSRRRGETRKEALLNSGSSGGSVEAIVTEAFGAGHFARGSAPLVRAACVCGAAARRGGVPGSPPPIRRSRAPPSGRRAASLRPRLVGGAAHVTALRACGRCRFPQSPSEREETRWRLKAIRSGAPAIRIEPSPSTRFRRPGPSRPAPRASPPGPGAPHRHPSARPSPSAFPSPPAWAPT